jgi:branched-chain amino acid aminotransferase
LYLADEVFFTGTAAEVTPIRSVDKIRVGNGSVGPVSRAIRSEFYAIANGKVEDRHGWLTPVPVKQPVAV